MGRKIVKAVGAVAPMDYIILHTAERGVGE
jgi:hypothetical protein